MQSQLISANKTCLLYTSEFSSATEYHYKTYENIYRTSPVAKKCVAPDETTPADKPKAMILGAGPNRIGQGIEFDYCCVPVSYTHLDVYKRQRHQCAAAGFAGGHARGQEFCQ